MTEKQPPTSTDKCINCPHRGRTSQLLAKIAGKSELASGCEGPVRVAHGEIQTRVVYPGEPKPKKSEFNWNSLTGPAYGSDGPERYSRTEWTYEDVCGRENIEPREGEMPAGRAKETVWTNEDGSRHASFIKGDEEQLADRRATLGIMDLLDSVTDMQEAAERGDVEGVQKVQDKIGATGLRLEAVAGRGSETFTDSVLVPDEYIEASSRPELKE